MNIVFDFTNNLYITFFIGFCVIASISLIYYIFIFSKLAFYKKGDINDNPPPVSVIIVGKNEIDNFKSKLGLIIKQDYHEFEVIVVNDCSTDGSLVYLSELSREYPNFKLIDNKLEERFALGKKLGLTLGIKGAKYDYVLLTDADCVPNSKDWISTIMRNYNNKTEIVLGYSPYFYKKGFLNLLIRWETFITAFKYFSFSLSGLTYMGVGRNLSYKKNIFFDNKGFASHYNMFSGDDDLFINEVAKQNNTRIEIEESSFTYSEPKETFEDWFIQKKRHLTTGFKYKLRNKLMLGILSISEWLFYILFATLLILNFNIIIVLSIFLIRYFVQIGFLYLIKTKLKEKTLYIYLYPFIELFFMFFYTYIAYSNIFHKPKKWN